MKKGETAYEKTQGLYATRYVRDELLLCGMRVGAWRLIGQEACGWKPAHGLCAS